MSEPQTVAEHIAAEAAESAPPVAPVVEAKPAAVAVAEPEAAHAPEAEADSDRPDAELSEAGRKLRQNRADQRAARLKERNDALALELHRARELREEQARFDNASAPRRESEPVAQAPADDPTDPEPQEEDFASYGEYTRAIGRWAARAEFRQQQQQARVQMARSASQRDLESRAAALDDVAKSMREKYVDFDAITQPLVDALAGTRRGLDVSAYLAKFPDVAGEISYRLGKSPELLKAVTGARSQVELYDALASVKHTITAAKSAAKPVTSAARPPSQTVGAGASTTTPDTNRAGFSTSEHYRIEEAELRERRARGLRY